MTDHDANFVEAGFNPENESAILNVKKIDLINPMPEVKSFSISNLFYVEDKPFKLNSKHNDKAYDINLPAGSSRFLICRIPPITHFIAELNNPDVQSTADFIRFAMHHTISIDYFYIAKGAVTLHMANGDQYDFKQGDAFCLKGADHAWVNTNDTTCELVGMMLGAKE